jgi:hypothetical protein
MFDWCKFCLSILLVTTLLPEIHAQNAQKNATGSISGQIKVGEKAAPGIAVALTSAEMQGAGAGSSARAATDGDGRYLINNLAPGRYRVNVLAPGYVITGSYSSVQLGEGQSLSGADFVLTKGGVITGRVTGNGDRPVIGEPVILIAVDENGQPVRSPLVNLNNFRTDDRGIYRIYSIPTGRYLVSVGRGDGGGGRGGGTGAGFGGFDNSSSKWQRTYYPEAVEVAQASVIDIEAGKEVAGIDIRMASRDTYVVTGRVVDSDTGNPVTGVLIGHGRVVGRGDRGGRGGRGGRADRSEGNNNSNQGFVAAGAAAGTSGPDGEFRIEGLSPGDYAAYIAHDQAAGQNEFYSEPVSFTVSSQDVSGIEIKLRRGASISGVVSFEGMTDPTAMANLKNIIVSAQSRGARSESGVSMMSNFMSQVAPNGGFRVGGLSPGLVNLNVRDQSAPGPFSGLAILRIERNGADLRSGLQVESGEQVTGVRIVLTYGTSIVRGVVRVEDGTLTPNLRLMVFARRTDVGRGAGGPMGGGMPAQVEANGRFQIERLVAGTYEISVQMMGGRGAGFAGGRRSGTASQTIVVGNNSAVDVVIPLNLGALLNPQADQNNTGGQGRRRGGRP